VQPAPAAQPDRHREVLRLADDADTLLDAERVAWTALIIVMENAHRARLRKRFGCWLKGERVASLDSPDDYDFMQPKLVAWLQRSTGPLLR
jgi:predicted protein tyrosine phosphatase